MYDKNLAWRNKLEAINFTVLSGVLTDFSLGILVLVSMLPWGFAWVEMISKGVFYQLLYGLCWIIIVNHCPLFSIVRWTVRAGFFNGSLEFRKTNFSFMNFVFRDPDSSMVVDIICLRKIDREKGL